MLPVHDDPLPYESKAPPRTPPPLEEPTLEEEEGEIKDDEEVEPETHPTPMEAEPVRAPSPPPPSPVKKVTKKNLVKPNKKPGPPKKRKIDMVKSEPVQEDDDLDSSTLAKRKKRYASRGQKNALADEDSLCTLLTDFFPSATNLHPPVIQKEGNDGLFSFG